MIGFENLTEAIGLSSIAEHSRGAHGSGLAGVLVEVFADHFAVQVEADVLREFGFFEDGDFGGVVAGGHGAFGFACKVKENDYVDAATRGESTDDFFDFDFQTGFFEDFSGGGFFGGFTGFDEATGQAPVVYERLAVSAHKHQSAVDWNEGRGHGFWVVPVYEIAARTGDPLAPANSKHFQFIRTNGTIFDQGRTRLIPEMRILAVLTIVFNPKELQASASPDLFSVTINKRFKEKRNSLLTSSARRSGL